MKPQCDYVGARGHRCPNKAKWRIQFTTPDDGKAMRQRREVVRCYWHEPERFFPSIRRHSRAMQHRGQNDEHSVKRQF